MTSPENTHEIVAENPDHASRKHAKISPSKLNYIDPAVGGCLGFESREGTSAAAEDGTRLHEILDKLIVEYVQSGEQGTFEGFLFRRRVALKWDDDDDYVLTYCARVVDRYLPKRPKIFNEIRIKIHDLSGNVVTWGHFDLLLVIGDVGLLIDYKFGWHPVIPAQLNRQGIAYAVGAFQKWRELAKIGVIFVQPRLAWTSQHVFERREIAALVETITKVIRAKEAAEVAPLGVEGLNPGSACEYCAQAATCQAYLQTASALVSRMGETPIPASFNLDAIDTPEKAAVAAYWVKFLEDKLPEIKKRAMEIARNHDGSVEYVTPDGTPIRFELQRRSLDREVGNAVEVSNSLTQWVSPEQVLGAAKLSLGKLTNIVVPAIQELHEMETGEKLTKKAATEILEGHLDAHGLLTRPDGYVEQLRQVKTKEWKKISNAKEKRSDTAE